jgi:hypothetical protein
MWKGFVIFVNIFQPYTIRLCGDILSEKAHSKKKSRLEIIY